MNAAFDEELGYWICTKCKCPYDPNCLCCSGGGSYLLESGIVECDCCACKGEYSI